jgi:hypothetical protein
MFSLTANIVIGVAVMAIALAFMVLVNRIWPVHVRYEKEDLIGWQLNMLATTHAVILGFMFYTEWTNFTAVKANVELEAGSLRNVFRLASGLPEPGGSVLRQQARAYADAVVKDDWPTMSRGQTPEVSHLLNESMWRTLTSVKDGSQAQLTVFDHALTELAAMTQCRRTRLLQADSKLPGIFWCVLVVGGLLTIGSVAMFGSRIGRLHLFQVVSLTLLVTLAMLAIADLDRPFQGWVRVGTYAFDRARVTMEAAP